MAKNRTKERPSCAGRDDYVPPRIEVYEAEPYQPLAFSPTITGTHEDATTNLFGGTHFGSSTGMFDGTHSGNTTGEFGGMHLGNTTGEYGGLHLGNSTGEFGGTHGTITISGVWE